jgi:P pilus assembly chaperone PapD
MTNRIDATTRRGRGQRIALVAAVLVAATRGAFAQVSVDELELHLTLRRGATSATEIFHAANPSTAPAQATISVQDWDRSEGGDNRYYPLGTLPGTCGPHVKVFPSVLQLEPRSTQTVRVTIDSAAAIQTGCYSILFVETPASPRGPNESALVYSVRYGVKVYVERDLPLAAEVEDVTVTKRDTTAKGDPSLKKVVVTYRNTGARQTLTHGSLEVRRPDNSLVTTVPISEFPTLPGATRRLGVPLPRLQRGKYVLLALLDYDGAEIAAGQVDLEIP